jgi:hypothetical protein
MDSESEKPIVIDSSNSKVISSPLGKDDSHDTNERFSSYWSEIDAAAAAKEAPPPPAAPSEPAREESEAPPDSGRSHPEEPAETPVQPLTDRAKDQVKRRRKLSESTKAPSESEISDAIDRPEPKPIDKVEAASDSDIDAMEPHPNASEGQKSQFRQLRDVAKHERSITKTYKEKLSPLLKEFGLDLTSDSPADIEKAIGELDQKVRSVRSAPAVDPAISQELETLRVFSRASALEKSISLRRGFSEPIQASWRDIVDEIASYVDAPPEQAQAWANELKAKHGPDAANSDWYSQQLNAMTRATPLDRQRVANKIGNLSNLIHERDRTIKDIAQNGNVYEHWKRAEAAQWTQNIDAEVRSAVEDAFRTTHKHLAEAGWKQKDPNDAEFARREKRFSNLINEFYQDPKKAAVYTLTHLEMEEKVPVLEKENKSLKAEVDRLKKRIGISRKVEDVPLRPSAGNGSGKSAPVKTKLSTGRDGLENAFREWVT